MTSSVRRRPWPVRDEVSDGEHHDEHATDGGRDVFPSFEIHMRAGGTPHRLGASEAQFQAIAAPNARMHR